MNHSTFVRLLRAVGLLGALTTGIDALANPRLIFGYGGLPISTAFGPPKNTLSSPDPQLLNLKPKNVRSVSATALDNQGLIDGVYVCDVTLEGKTERMLLTFNGKANGQTIYVVASMKTYYIAGPTRAVINQPFRGWGIGSLSAAGYVGTTWNGYPFSFTLLGLEENVSENVYDVLRIAGSVDTGDNQAAKLTCKSNNALF